ncbi:MAG: hypothetical protein ICV54_16860 [Nostoc sp. C3-bin3]|nr:hypothetical protein [Nostoc sp. C3-bin3]
MKFTTVSVSYSRKFNLGDYESLELGCSLWAQVEDGEDADGITQFLYQQAKTSVKQAAMPVLSTNRPKRFTSQRNSHTFKLSTRFGQRVVAFSEC